MWQSWHLVQKSTVLVELDGLEIKTHVAEMPFYYHHHHRGVVVVVSMHHASTYQIPSLSSSKKQRKSVHHTTAYSRALSTKAACAPSLETSSRPCCCTAEQHQPGITVVQQAGPQGPAPSLQHWIRRLGPGGLRNWPRGFQGVSRRSNCYPRRVRTTVLALRKCGLLQSLSHPHHSLKLKAGPVACNGR